IVAEIAAASREQATGLDQVNTAVGSMDEMTQRNGALVEQTSASAQALSNQANELAELVAFFKTGTEAPRIPAAEKRPAAPPPAPAPTARPAAKPVAKSAAQPAPAAAPKPAPVPAMTADDDDWQEF
ncbi:MAG TPA: methyl-accepting chemotaxis protein, partial [Ferrovibrio sp.]|nr:methyl-accepting chemotaxis protein [Ferrovibrio sp.]